MKKFRFAAVGIALLSAIAVSVGAFAAGYFPGWPIVGGAAYCTSYSGIGAGTGSSTFTGATAPFGANCNATAPAGPTSLTGNELVPADTQLANGQNPQTVLIPTVLLGAGATNYQAPLTGASVTANPSDSTMLLDPAGTIATLTVVMPGPAASLRDGQTWRLASSQTVTALTLTPGTGTTIASQTPTAITVSTTAPYNYEFVYKASNAKWYRIQ